jgi:ribonuclease P protein component
MGNVQRLTFRKRERLVSLRLIDDLFGGGSSRSVAAFPLRAIFKVRVREDHAAAPVQLLISVPKKHFHHAVDRNHVKRQIREAWRLHKQLLVEAIAPEKQLLVAFVWQSNQHLATSAVEERIANLTSRIAERMNS